jgi:replicative DNA helicase
MSRIDRSNLGYLGDDYQIRLINQLLIDARFANNIIDIISPNYFKDEYLRLIVATIKDAKDKEDVIPNINSIKFRLLSEAMDEFQRKMLSRQMEKIEQADQHDCLWVQDTAMRFCKKQELKKSIKEIERIIDKEDEDNYEECEGIIRKALEHGDHKDDSIDVFNDIDNVLSDDYRQPIRTGIKGLDEIMDGGLAKTELAIILAPFGVGKTTMITKIANTAMSDGYNVMQIFFEDNPKVIQRKHFSCWTGIDLNSLSSRKEEVKAIEKELKSKPNAGQLVLKKFRSDGTTIPMIYQYIRKKISEGFRPDIILLDYIDCVQPSKKYDDANVGEGAVMRQFESMLAELNIAGWTAVQGNRSSIKANIVESDQMGGSIKKGQIGHFVLSIAKSLDQKENGTANIAILKSRFGKSGVVFEDVVFDNSTIQIHMGENSAAKTRTEYREDKEAANVSRVAHLMNRRSALQNEN